MHLYYDEVLDKVINRCLYKQVYTITLSNAWNQTDAAIAVEVKQAQVLLFCLQNVK